jgi:hypothetical protein
MLLNLFVTAMLVITGAIISIVVAVAWSFAELFKSNSSAASHKPVSSTATRTAFANGARPGPFGMGRAEQPVAPTSQSRRSSDRPLDVELAAQLTYELLGGTIGLVQLREYVIAAELKLDPVSSHDLAALTAIGFFKSPALTGHLKQFQLLARLTALDWFKADLLSGPVLRIFEHELYATYSA